MQTDFRERGDSLGRPDSMAGERHYSGVHGAEICFAGVVGAGRHAPGLVDRV